MQSAYNCFSGRNVAEQANRGLVLADLQLLQDPRLAFYWTICRVGLASRAGLPRLWNKTHLYQHLARKRKPNTLTANCPPHCEYIMVFRHVCPYLQHTGYSIFRFTSTHLDHPTPGEAKPGWVIWQGWHICPKPGIQQIKSNVWWPGV